MIEYIKSVLNGGNFVASCYFLSLSENSKKKIDAGLCLKAG